jgi:uncharacterized protein (DUF302 family)
MRHPTLWNRRAVEGIACRQLRTTHTYLETLMSYYLSRNLHLPFEEALSRATHALQAEGFGIISDIDVAGTLKQKIGVDYPAYRILGACNPAMAHEALELEDKVGTMLPCNVVVRDAGNGTTEIAAVDPVASMQAIENDALADKARAVRQKLEAAVQRL